MFSYGIITRLINDESQDAVGIQKQILKIYFALTQYVLPLDLITKEVFAQWMEVLRVITESDVPQHTLQVRLVLVHYWCKYSSHRLMRRKDHH